ncbi:MAG: formamidopyrimidine-DNA glycosylase [Polyangiaceae bacterium]|nr:formamidopyrimidine-DNA glycosylase [Polyangiaceae bacterium]
MPELPDLVVYAERLAALVAGQPLERVRLFNPFVLRSYEPPLSAVEGRGVLGVQRLGKQLVIGLERELFLVLHLMISGRLLWRPRGTAPARKVGAAAFDFPNGSLLLTEASTKKRASLYLVEGRDGVASFDRGGIEPLDATEEQFTRVLRSENHTLKRALTDPRLFSGIGNAFSDEILHRARLSPVARSQSLDAPAIARLRAACRETLREWTDRLRRQTPDPFPEKVTALHEEMAVHGRFGQACPVCGTRIQRIVHAQNEANYCPTCQTDGRLLADRALSRLLGTDWPRSLEQLEEHLAERRTGTPQADVHAERSREPRRRAAKRPR